MTNATGQATIAKAKVFANSMRDSMAQSIVSEWKFDELSTAINGTVVKDSWGNNDGILNTGTGDTTDKLKLETNCVFGKCLYFDGIGDYIAYNNIDNPLSSITVSAWINPSLVNSWSQASVLTKFELNKYQWKIGLTNTGLVRFDIYTSQSSNTFSVSSSSLQSNQWYYIVGTFDGSYIKTYLNGKIGNSIASGGSIQNVDAKINMGLDSVSNRYFSGMIDDVRIYSTALPLAQIKQQYYADLQRLYASKGITQEEYNQRLASLNNYCLANK
jgi:hypothetical protein